MLEGKQTVKCTLTHTHTLPLRAAGHRGADTLEASEEPKMPLKTR